MKNATKNTVAAALAVALAGMGLPAAALAANAADEASSATTAAALAETAPGLSPELTLVAAAELGTPKYITKDDSGSWYAVDKDMKAARIEKGAVIGGSKVTYISEDGYRWAGKKDDGTVVLWTLPFYYWNNTFKRGEYDAASEWSGEDLEKLIPYGKTTKVSLQGVYIQAGNKVILTISGREDARIVSITGSGALVHDDADNGRYDMTGKSVFGYAKSITIGKNITAIGDSWFHGCLNEGGTITFAKGCKVKTIGDYAFAYCSPSKINLGSLSYLKRIGGRAFLGITMAKGTSVTIPASCEYVGPWAFFDNPWSNVTVANRENTSICKWAFWKNHHNPSKLVGDFKAPTVTAKGGKQVSVKWNPMTSFKLGTYAGWSYSDHQGAERTYYTGVTKYKVQYRVKDSSKWKFTKLTSSRSITLKGLSAGEKYQIRVTGYKKVGSKYAAQATTPWKTVTVKQNKQPAGGAQSPSRLARSVHS